MNAYVAKLVNGAIQGLLAAVVVDLHGWCTVPGPFDWRLALRRWVLGAVSGLAAGFALLHLGGS